MKRARRRLRVVLLLSVALVATGIAIAAYAGDLLDGPELDTVDTRFSLRGEAPSPEDVVVVGIDDVTFGELNRRFPFPRSLHARVVERLRAAGARTIAYDVQFTEPSADPAQDDALIEAVRRAGNVVLATTEVDERGRSGVFGGPAALRYARARDADASLRPDADGVFRRISYSLQGLPSFAAVAASDVVGRPVQARDFPEEESWVDFHGRPGTIDQVPFSRVLRGRVDAERLRGRVAVVGATAPSLQDVRPTATSGEELMSGPEFQANAISTVLRDFPLRASSTAVDVLLILLLTLAAPLLAMFVRPLLSIGLAVVAGLGYVGVAILLFEAGTVLPVTYPLLGLAVAGVGSLGVHYVTTAYERERVRDVLSRIVNDSVADTLMGRDQLELGCVDAEGTVLFTDLRGFTSYAESHPPARVIEVLNRYHTEMEDVLFKNGGTLISYTGDGIIAVFGVPQRQADHADRALAAAREMIGERLESFNAWMRSAGHGDGFRMGVGLNSGHVLAGQVGSERRFEYTVIGDTVNTASRLEGMTKGTPHMLFAADSVREQLMRDVPDLVLVDELAVRGRQAKVRVWSLASG